MFWLWLALTAGVIITSHVKHGARRQAAAPRLVGSHGRQSDLRRTVGVALLVSRYPSRIPAQSQRV